MECQVCKGFIQVKAATESHFKNLYSEGSHVNEEETINFLSNIPLLIRSEDNAALSSDITEEEIIKVIWSMESDKAPRPDRFTIHFYKSCWNTIKKRPPKNDKGIHEKS